MAEVHESVEVGVPVSTAYNQWTQFEEFPRFMENVESVTQIDDAHLRWVAEIGGKRHEWEAEIVRQEPDRVVAWRSVDGKGTSGEVKFEPLGADRTKIDVTISWEPEGLMESLGAKIGADTMGVKKDLDNFKELIEGRGVETGAWRGEVTAGERIDR
ncbi:MAG TPA: SRPBCC family protein [Gaiellaceae bacterium]|nr:SRPBCC family protein [Gaiellaceae bacterium]